MQMDSCRRRCRLRANPASQLRKALIYAILLLGTIVLQGDPHAWTVENFSFHLLLQEPSLLALLLVDLSVLECITLIVERCLLLRLPEHAY